MMSERDAHPDEGTIHAWLDRQLDDTSAATLELMLGLEEVLDIQIDVEEIQIDVEEIQPGDMSCLGRLADFIAGQLAVTG